MRPLRLGDILDAAVKIVRHNPGATVGASLLVSAVAMLVPVLATAVLWSLTGLAGALDPLASTTTAQTEEELLATLAVLVSWLAGVVLQYVGIILVTGMVVQVTGAATLGRQLSLGEAWAATAGRRFRLVGLVVVLALLATLAMTIYVIFSVGFVMTGSVAVIVIWFLVSLPLLLVASVWFWIKIAFLPSAVLVAEDIGVIASMVRGAHLVKGHFWRILGIALLVNLLAQVVAGIIAVPLSILGVIPPLMGASEETGLLLSVGTQVLAIIFGTALTTPFLAATTALLHLDLRIRKEAYDVELIQQAGLGHR